jgi:formylmethanofuran dehydrogenase subunit B
MTDRARAAIRTSKMGDAWINGAIAPLGEAITAAAQMLAKSKQPLIAGMGVDVAGARAALALADQVGGVVDHMHSQAILRDLDCARETGVFLTTPLETRVRSDVILLVGPDLDRIWPDLRSLLRCPAEPAEERVKRRIYWLCPGRKPPNADGLDIETFGRDAGRLAEFLSVLRARIRKRPVAMSGAIPRQLDQLVGQLQSARFGVAIWSAQTIEAMPLEMLNGIVRDLNETTRFSSLPLCCPDNAAGVLATCGWITGYPMRSAFGRGQADHDPWRYAAARLDASGEIDCTLWLSAYRPLIPNWSTKSPLIAMTGIAAPFAAPPNVHIVVGRPGVDHDGTSFSAASGSLQYDRASHPSGVISVAAALTQLQQSIRQIRG